MSLTTAPELVSLSQIAKSFGVQARTVRAWGVLPTIKLRGKFYVPADALAHFRARLKNQRPDRTSLREYVWGEGIE